MTSEARRAKNRIYNIAYRERHRAKVRAANAKWLSENPDFNSAKRGIQRAKNWGCEAVETGTPEFEQIKALYRRARELTAETDIVHHVDHVVAFSQGGAHHPHNMQILTADEHYAKTKEERSVRHDVASV